MYKMNKVIYQLIISAAVFMLAACSPYPSLPENTSAPLTELPPETSAAQTASAETVIAAVTETTAVSPEKGSVKDILNSLTEEEKVGQMLLARFPESGAAEMMEKYSLGGYTLYANDFKNETPDTVPEMIEKIQAAAKVPAFIAVDEEGGTVVRISKFPQFRPIPFESQIALARGGEELVRSGTEEKSKLLLSLGINLNLAPVADFTEDHLAYIFDRTFGCGLDETADYTALTVEVMNENHIGSCLKHFPGYGPNSDTHTGIAADARAAEEFENADFIPFRRGIEAGAPAVMVCHNIVNAYDSELPASLSPAVHELLRGSLGFEGVIISDDLGMEAIKQYSGDESPYVLAVLAGNDLVCTSDAEAAYNDIIAAVKDGRIPQPRLDESVTRILEMKKALNII